MSTISKLVWIPICITCMFCLVIGSSVYRHNLYFTIIGIIGLFSTMFLMNTILKYKESRDKEFIDLMNKIEAKEEKESIDLDHIN